MGKQRDPAKAFLRAGPAAVLLAAGLAIDAYAQSGAWSAKAPMPTARCCAGAAVTGQRLFVLGGVNLALSPPLLDSVEAYDARTNEWTPEGTMPFRRTSFATAALDGIVYVAGGQDYGAPYILASVEAYDTKTGTWSSRAPMPTPRWELVLVAAAGKLYAIGGEDSAGMVTTAEAYDPATNTWSKKSPMPAPRLGFAAASIGDVIYVVGGQDLVSQPDGRPKTVYAFDTNTDAWTTRAPIPTARDSLAVAVLDGILYALGGQNQFGLLATAEQYDPRTDSWSTAPPMPTTRGWLVVGSVDDTIYAVGGLGIDASTRSNIYLATNEAFTPFEMVSIDIKPGDRTNTINLGSNGVIPVAILGSATFNPMTVDPTTVTFAGAHVATRGRGVPMTGQSDVNHDGYPDLVLYFRTQDLTDLQSAAADHRSALQLEAVLYGTTYSGQRIRGSDTVRLLSPPKPNASPFRPLPTRGRGVSGR